MISLPPQAPDLRDAYAYCAAFTRRHTENFTVASWFLPRAKRPHFFALYAFCRGVDDLGDAAPGDRLALLDEWERHLAGAYRRDPPAHPVFRALQATIREFDIPPDPFERLIEANRRDQRITVHPTYADLLDYCTYSANPVGHLVLHVFGYRDAHRQALADNTCTALQLANFWQDVARDHAMGRIYLPREDLDRFGYPPENLAAGLADDAFRRLMAFEVDRARALFAAGAPLTSLVAPELRLDLRLFTLGGLAVLDAIEARHYDVLSHRPTIPRWKRAALVARALVETGRGRWTMDRRRWTMDAPPRTAEEEVEAPVWSAGVSPAPPSAWSAGVSPAPAVAHGNGLDATARERNPLGAQASWPAVASLSGTNDEVGTTTGQARTPAPREGYQSQSLWATIRPGPAGHDQGAGETPALQAARAPTRPRDLLSILRGLPSAVRHRPPPVPGLRSTVHGPPSALAAAYDHCWAITRREAKNFYFGFVALPAEKRRAIYAAYAFSRRVDDEADAAADAVERAARLAESRRQLAAAYAGEAADPVLLALGDAARRFGIPRDYFDELITGVEMDLTITRYATFEDLRLYCYRVASVVGLICLEIFGYRDPRARDHAIDLGIALQLTNILRDVQEDAARGRIYLPLEDLAELGVAEEDILRGRRTGLVRSLLRYQAERARAYHDRGRRLLPLLDVRGRACTGTMQALYETILAEIEARECDVFAGRVGLSTPRKLALMGQVWARSVAAGPAR